MPVSVASRPDASGVASAGSRSVHCRTTSADHAPFRYPVRVFHSPVLAPGVSREMPIRLSFREQRYGPSTPIGLLGVEICERSRKMGRLQLNLSPELTEARPRC